MTVGELKYLIEDTVRGYLFENVGHGKPINRNPIAEMARLNTKDAGAVPFPSNKFDIRIWNNDHLPPTFSCNCRRVGYFFFNRRWNGISCQ